MIAFPLQENRHKNQKKALRKTASKGARLSGRQRENPRKNSQAFLAQFPVGRPRLDESKLCGGGSGSSWSRWEQSTRPGTAGVAPGNVEPVNRDGTDQIRRIIPPGGATIAHCSTAARGTGLMKHLIYSFRDGMLSHHLQLFLILTKSRSKSAAGNVRTQSLSL